MATERVYVWEFPVRFVHWINVLSIAVLSFTGFYIGRPFIHATGSEEYIMGWTRFIHFVAAYVFSVCFFVRIYWAFVGKEYALWKEFIPLTTKRWAEIFECIKFYLFLRKPPPFSWAFRSGRTYLFFGVHSFFYRNSNRICHVFSKPLWYILVNIRWLAT